MAPNAIRGSALHPGCESRGERWLPSACFGWTLGRRRVFLTLLDGLCLGSLLLRLRRPRSPPPPTQAPIADKWTRPKGASAREVRFDGSLASGSGFVGALAALA